MPLLLDFRFLRFFLLIFLLFNTWPSFSQAARVGSAASRFLNFQFCGIAVLAKGGGSSISDQLSWTPYWALSSVIGLRGSFGVAMLNDSGGDRFFATDYEALFSVGRKFAAEIGGGLQHWYVKGGLTQPAYSFNFVYRRNSLPLDRFLLGFTYYRFSSVVAYELKVGLGIIF